VRCHVGPCRPLLVTLVAFAYAAIAFPEALTVSDAIQTTRFMVGAPSFATVTPSGEFLNSGPVQIFASPDNRLWAAMLIKGDLEKNGNWAEILVGSLESLDAATHPRVLARLFTHALGNGGLGSPLTLAGHNRQPLLQWVSDNRGLALLWSDDADRKQIFVVDVPTGKIQQLSNHPTSIISFANRGDTFIYIAEENSAATLAERAKHDPRRGTTIETRYLPAALAGEMDGDVEGPFVFKWFILDATTGESKDIAGLPLSRFNWTGATFSGDGSFAIVESSPESVPESWERYTAGYWSLVIQRARSDRNDMFGRQLMQLYVVDVRQARAWPLWDAPGRADSRIAWSPDGHSVAMSPTFVPISGADDAGLTGYATAVVEINGGRFRAIPISPRSPLAPASLRWLEPTTIGMQDGNVRYEFREDKGEWTRSPRLSRRTGRATSDQAAIDLRIEEGINRPPTLVATDRRSGGRRVIYDPNPQLRDRFSLGRVAMIDWRDREGRVWVGRLYYPVGWQAGRRYPLVIQTAGYANSKPDQQFSLYGIDIGPGLGPGASMLVAQPLANRGIMVLSTERKSLPDILSLPNDAPMHAAAYEAAVDYLDGKGLIDRQRVGISGFSNTGYLVQYALVHSDLQYAAAITDDNYDGSYFQAVMSGSKQFAIENGAEPYGEGLKLWMQRAPGFNADKIRTPLRLQASSPPPTSILASWEMFTRLRELNKPVEFFLIPDIEHGNHTIQNPAQCLASQEGAVDWFDFWLNDREDPDPGKADQYARWRKLRGLNKPVAVSARDPSVH
jgi:hypothetical protein